MRSHHGRFLALALVVALAGCTPTPGGTETAASVEPPVASVLSASPSDQAEAEVTDLMNGFLEARVAGEAAQQYLNVPEADIPLLYATTSGAPYERAEFERVRGTEWPYGWMAFKVRLFAGDTVVEQLFFHDGREGGLEYQGDGFATDIAPTTEDGTPLAIPHNYFDGEVTLRAAHPWVFGGIYAALIPEGPGVPPTTDGGERHGHDWDHLWLLADPLPVGTGCQAGPAPADAEVLADSIRSDPGLGMTTPVVVSVGGTEALMMDVAIAAGATVCVPTTSGGDPLLNALLRPVLDIYGAGVYDSGVWTGHATGEWMRLYLFDAPEGSSIGVLAIAIVAPEARFQRAVEAAAPVLESLEFHLP
jgi:hypothetical protein